MLLLSRRKGEKVVIGESITITVTAIKGGKVSLGIETPRGVRVVRREIEGSPDPKKERTDS